MSRVFIGGSRHLSRLDPTVRARLDSIVGKRLRVLVGDANGADKAVQTYLADGQYDLVEVFCSGPTCRNNIGQWRTRHIAANPRDRGFRFFAAKDRAMTAEADFGFMLWDGKSTGTLLNVLRLLRQGKKIVIFVAPDGAFHELVSLSQWEDFTAGHDADLRAETQRKATLEARSFDVSEPAGTSAAFLLPLAPG